MDQRWSGVPPASLANIAAASVALHGSPEAALLAAALAAPLEEGVGAAFDTVRGLVRRNQQAALGHSAVASNLGGAEEVVGALTRSPEGILLLGEALTAAARSTEASRIRALGDSLATAAVDGASIQIETLFVRAIADLDLVHIRVLAAFTKSSNELGLGSGEPDFDKTVSALNRTQLSEYVLPDLAAVLEPVVATLTRHALLRQGSGTWADLEGNATYKITPFGEECLHRLEQT